jgi:hypothetical protein
MLWFICQLHLRLGISFSVLRTDSGGELWGSHAFRNCLLKEAHCLIELAPTTRRQMALSNKELEWYACKHKFAFLLLVLKSLSGASHSATLQCYAIIVQELIQKYLAM